MSHDPRKLAPQVYFLSEENGELHVAQEANRQWGSNDIITEAELIDPVVERRPVHLTNGKVVTIDVFIEPCHDYVNYYARADDLKA